VARAARRHGAEGRVVAAEHALDALRGPQEKGKLLERQRRAGVRAAASPTLDAGEEIAVDEGCGVRGRQSDDLASVAERLLEGRLRPAEALVGREAVQGRKIRFH